MHQELEGAALTLHAWVEIRITMEPVYNVSSLESNFIIDFTSENQNSWPGCSLEIISYSCNQQYVDSHSSLFLQFALHRGPFIMIFKIYREIDSIDKYLQCEANSIKSIYDVKFIQSRSIYHVQGSPTQVRGKILCGPL